MSSGNIHRCAEPTIVFFKDNSIVELDFKIHTYNRPTAIFLKKGQYFKLLDGSPELFPLSQNIDLSHYRYLFSHLTGIGHVLFNSSTSFEPDLERSLSDWRAMNPFNATENELNLLFDTNDFIENNLDPALPVTEAFPSYRDLNEISATHINHSLHEWKTHKLIVQAKYLLFFAGKSIQEVAYELRFKDPAYFGRYFKRITEQTPGQFVDQHDESPSKYVLLDQLNELIDQYFKSQHLIQFYADKLSLTSKTLSEKIQKLYGLSVKDMITNRLAKEAELLLTQGHKMTEIAFMLGFKEVSHFSAFYKKHSAVVDSKSTRH